MYPHLSSPLGIFPLTGSYWIRPAPLKLGNQWKMTNDSLWQCDHDYTNVNVENTVCQFVSVRTKWTKKNLLQKWSRSQLQDNHVIQAVDDQYRRDYGIYRNGRCLFTVALWNLINVMLLTFSHFSYPIVNHTTCQWDVASHKTFTTTLVFACFSLRCIYSICVIHYKFIVIH